MPGKSPKHILTMVMPLLIILLALTVTAVAQSTHQPTPKPKIRMLSPRAGDTFIAGQKITVVWQVDLPANINPSLCEQEIFLSTDGGKTVKYRLTPELSSSLRSYELTLPNLPTDQAVIDIRFGSEYSRNRFERANVQKHAAFRILASTSNVEEIKLNRPSLENALPGDQIELNWNSSVVNIANYELLISYDQGAHFHTLGRTNNEIYNWTVPDNFSGFVTFKVVAHKLDGSAIESITDAEPIVVSRGQ